MATFGAIVWRNGKAVLTPDNGSGVFQRLVTFGVNNASFTFTEADTMELFWVSVSGGNHNIQYGRDANGYPYLYADGYPVQSDVNPDPAVWQTTVAVFSR
jgi:hypothetical protein